jgi:hypothetical protein
VVQKPDFWGKLDAIALGLHYTSRQEIFAFLRLFPFFTTPEHALALFTAVVQDNILYFSVISVTIETTEKIYDSTNIHRTKIHHPLG